MRSLHSITQVFLVYIVSAESAAIAKDALVCTVLEKCLNENWVGRVMTSRLNGLSGS